MFQTLESSDFESNTGIGLALVKKIVEEHGGAIWLESAVGEGACFYFTWPKKHSETELGEK
jgi:signal transduction histidine kinase